MNFNEMIEEKQRRQEKALDEALKHLAHRDRTTDEIRRNLTEKGFDGEEIKKTIVYLADMHYIDDTAYVEKYIQYAVSKGKGSVKITHELKEKGIDTELLEDIRSYSEEITGQSERERAYKQALKVVGSKSPAFEEDETDEMGEDFNQKMKKYKEMQKAKAKVARRLENQGFSRDVIFSTIDEIFT